MVFDGPTDGGSYWAADRRDGQRQTMTDLAEQAAQGRFAGWHPILPAKEGVVIAGALVAPMDKLSADERRTMGGDDATLTAAELERCARGCNLTNAQ